MNITEERLNLLKENTPTIISPNCWGGLTYHSLGLRFESPLINMFEDHDDFLKLLSKPEHYLNSELRFVRANDEHPNHYPIAALDDIEIHMNHDRTYAEAKKKWDRRQKRIKWDNLFIMFWDEDPERVKKFQALPYPKKICLVPWETSEEGLIPLPYKKKEYFKSWEFWKITTYLGAGYIIQYDPVELLLEGKYIQTGNLEINKNDFR